MDRETNQDQARIHGPTAFMFLNTTADLTTKQARLCFNYNLNKDELNYIACRALQVES